MSQNGSGFSEWVRRLEALPSSTQSALTEALLDRSLELYINSTEHCNFRCKYCYEDFSKGRMPQFVIERVKLFIDKRTTGRKRLYLNWFGGEPLIATDIVLDISRYAKTLCESKGLGLSGSVTTNGGNLSVSMMSELLSAGLSFYQITLDGDRESHDRMRVRADGKGTFDTIWSNLLALHQSDLRFTILLRVHLRPGNLDNIRSLFYSVREHFQGDKRFTLGLYPLRDLGGPTHGSFETLSDEDCGLMYSALREEFNDEFIIYGDGTGIDDAGKAEGCGLSVCYACKSNSFLIRSDGSIGKCTVALDKDFNSVGVLQANGELALNESRFKNGHMRFTRWSPIT